MLFFTSIIYSFTTSGFSLLLSFKDFRSLVRSAISEFVGGISTSFEPCPSIGTLNFATPTLSVEHLFRIVVEGIYSNREGFSCTLNCFTHIDGTCPSKFFLGKWWGRFVLR